MAVTEELRIYQHKEAALSIEGRRVVIATAGRQAVLQLLHGGHPGVSRRKSLARGNFLVAKYRLGGERIVQSHNACNKEEPRVPLYL